MTNRSQLNIVLALCASFLAAACDRGPYAGEKITILDAVEIYNANTDVFAGVRQSYPGPFLEFSRVPDRDPAKVTPAQRGFIKQLRKQFPVEFIDLYPMGDAEKDQIDVVLQRYGATSRWTVVSLIYVDIPLPAADAKSGTAVFNTCDNAVIGWLEFQSESGRAAAFCRISKHWYAHQRIG